MSFDTNESSVEHSQPIELYEFSFQNRTYFYTSGQQNLAVGGINYLQAPMVRSDITNAADVSKSPITIDVPPHFQVSELFNPFPPDDTVTLIVKRFQYMDGLVNPTLAIIWVGRVISVTWVPGKSVISCDSIHVAMKAQGVRRIYSRTCPHVLYGRRCQASQLQFQQQILLATVNNFTLTSANPGLGFDAEPDGWWVGGFMQWTSPDGLTAQRSIKTHVGNIVTITYEIPGLAAGDAILAFAGCDHTSNTCINKFNNILNHGGFFNLPKLNPFGTYSVF